MDAGRHLDKIIASLVGLDSPKFSDYMGYEELVYRPHPETCPDFYALVPTYSTDISDAFELFSRFHRFKIVKSEMPEHYHAEIVCHMGMGSFEVYRAEGETIPHAMCLAAKKYQERDYDDY